MAGACIGERHFRFNPLPSTKRGEISTIGSESSRSPVSIRSPQRSEGRSLWRHVATRSGVRFNPLPSTKRGEIHSARVTEATLEFQSAPLNEARGDDYIRKYDFDRSCFNPLPSTKRGEIRRNEPRAACVQMQVSIRSPQRSEGRCS